MGLAMVYGIVSNHGGNITLESQKGKGTSFFISLPSVAPRLVDLVERKIDAPAHGRGCILVVDDHDVARSATTAMLESLGYEVVAVKDGVEAVQYVSEHVGSVNLVVLDFIMPGMSAAECLESLRNLDSNLRVVLSTGFANSLSVQRLLEAEGVFGMVQKPFQLARLSHVVSEALQSKTH
jgi:CheY-like chemotaxis protein